MYRDGVRCASGRSVSSQTRRVQSRVLAQSEGDGSEEAGGEDRHKRV